MEENILITKDNILETLPLELSDLEASMIHFDTKNPQFQKKSPVGEFPLPGIKKKIPGPDRE